MSTTLLMPSEITDKAVALYWIDLYHLYE